MICSRTSWGSVERSPSRSWQYDHITLEKARRPAPSSTISIGIAHSSREIGVADLYHASYSPMTAYLFGTFLWYGVRWLWSEGSRQRSTNFCCCEDRTRVLGTARSSILDSDANIIITPRCFIANFTMHNAINICLRIVARVWVAGNCQHVKIRVGKARNIRGVQITRPSSQTSTRWGIRWKQYKCIRQVKLLRPDPITGSLPCSL